MSSQERVQTQSSSCCGPSQDVLDVKSGDGQKPVYSGWVTAAAKYAMYAPAAESNTLKDAAGNVQYPLPGPVLVTEVVQDANIKAGSKVLEVAASVGHIAMIGARIAGPEGEAVMGQLDPHLIEPTEAYLAEHGLQNSVRVVEANSGKIPYDDNYFDAVISDRAACCLFSEAESQQRFLEELARVTKPNGRVVIIEAVPLSAPPEGKRIPGCIANTTFTKEPEKVVGMLRHAGLESISIKRLQGAQISTEEMFDAAGLPSGDGYLEFGIISGTKKGDQESNTLESIAKSGAGCCNPLDEE
jgi:SAM-dependent methyltransferase